MTQSARHKSHVSSACVNCRRRKRKCSGAKPTCALCAEKNVHVRLLDIEHHRPDGLNDRQCEWTVESDGRRGCRPERDALRVENEQLKSELALLHAQLRGTGVENAHNGLTYHAVQTQQLQLWVPEEGVDCAGLALQTNIAQQAAEPAGAFVNMLPHWAPCDPIGRARYVFPAEQGPSRAVENTADPADAASVQAVNVFGPFVPPLATCYPIPQDSHM